MNCTICGGTLNHIITDIAGKNYYQCHTGLTHQIVREVDHRSHPICQCGQVYDQKGQKFSGHVSFISDGKLKTIRIPEEL